MNYDEKLFRDLFDHIYSMDTVITRIPTNGCQQNKLWRIYPLPKQEHISTIVGILNSHNLFWTIEVDYENRISFVASEEE
jgi:hypothetical protein